MKPQTELTFDFSIQPIKSRQVPVPGLFFERCLSPISWQSARSAGGRSNPLMVSLWRDRDRCVLCTRACTCVCVCMYVFMHTCVCLCMCVYIRVYICVCMCLSVHACLCVWACVCVVAIWSLVVEKGCKASLNHINETNVYCAVLFASPEDAGDCEWVSEWVSEWVHRGFRE